MRKRHKKQDLHYYEIMQVLLKKLIDGHAARQGFHETLPEYYSNKRDLSAVACRLDLPAIIEFITVIFYIILGSIIVD